MPPVNSSISETNLPEDAPLEDITEVSTSEPERISRGRLVFRRFWRPLTTKIGSVGLLLIILAAIFGPYLVPYGIMDIDSSAFRQGPSAAHWFGTTQAGKDILALTLEGLRKSLIIGFSVAFIQTALAAMIGSAAAYFGETVGKVLLWFIDLMLVIPSFLMIAIISQKMGGTSGSITMFIILLAAFGWMLSARVVRAMTLSVISLDYVNAAKFMSVPSPVIIARHVIPNISSYLIIDFTLGFASAVLSETALSFFGFGVKPPNTSLGTLIAEGQVSALTFPWVFAAPAMFLVLTLLFVNLLGDSLRDALDPSSKASGSA